MNWWTEFSSWQDYKGLLHTGKTLKIHEIVKNISKHFETVENNDSYIKNIVLYCIVILKLFRKQ